jgi:C-terminal peptidase prc
MRIRILFIVLAISCFSCSGSKFVTKKTYYRTVLNLIERNYTTFDGTPFVVDTTGHPPLDKIAQQLDGYSKLVRTRKDSQNNYEIVYDGPPVSTPSYYIYHDYASLGYIHIGSFGEGISTYMSCNIDSLTKKGIKRLIIDLRNCPGGPLDEVVHCTEVFLPQHAIIGTQKSKVEDDNETYSVKEQGNTSCQCIVLIDSLTSCGAELMAGALQENKRAILLGSRTMGKANVQRMYFLADTLGFRLTVGYLYLPSGKSFQNIGIQPDIAISDSVWKSITSFPQTEKELLSSRYDSLTTMLYNAFHTIKGID